ncbi:unnamed protein product [Adineta steineri]|uniref:MD-2-related lipid-recognition domain-containing protein n=1 Tax=Adineta steineri TaxID=433720 RepID=A0A816A5L4_9BILA|nr:unnamed protein product [Adineta steineri]CAF1342280.1 unnamed protein product [Adineta steineri]CAF1593393.1 unnamed protein product [Adineta steineri]CAF1593585.1 unnamed protein product [Adineta steineri]
MYTVQMNDVDLNCLKDSKKLSSFSIRVISFNIWNDQLSIPGILDLSLSINVTKKLSADIQFSTKVERKFGLAWIDLPCLAGIGACDKQSLCDLIKQACKTNGFIRKNNQNTKLHVPAISILREKSAKLVKPVTTGQYRFKVIFFETKSKTTVGCVTGYLTLLKPKI